MTGEHPEAQHPSAWPGELDRETETAAGKPEAAAGWVTETDKQERVSFRSTAYKQHEWSVTGDSSTGKILSQA